jgi:carbon-monoxide dehydrogenase medium subunit
LAEFYIGVRKTVLQPDEMLVEIGLPAMKSNQCGTFLKLGLRRAQAISVVNAAVVLELDSKTIEKATITLGAVAPTIIRTPEAEAYLVGKKLSDSVIDHAGELAAKAARPIDDVRGSAAYRRAMVKTLVTRALRQLSEGREKDQVPEIPVLLWGRQSVISGQRSAFSSRQSVGSTQTIRTKINGKDYTFIGGQGKSLLRLLREEAGLTGTKEGCAEGECGACTVFLDGKAVMACLVPAPRADGAEIVTVEGLALGERLHPVQEAFITQGAVQCGYCTPGFIMSAAKLLEERPHPTRAEVTQAITGNLCRCTGYYKIVQAIEAAGQD